MCETKVHQFEKDFPFATGLSVYIIGKRVKTGEVLKITHISANFDNVATSEYIVLGYWNGHGYVPLKKDKPAEAGDYVHWDGEIYLREQQYVYAYLKDVANGEVMRLRALGKYE